MRLVAHFFLTVS